MTWTKALGLAVSFALLPACSDGHEERDFELIIDNNGPVSVDVLIWEGGSFILLEDHKLDPFEVASIWLSEEVMKDHPDLRIHDHSEGDELIDLTLHRSYFSGPGLSFLVAVYP